jgi:pSer/pThr/pTyr-binding forkhead associated (FHA) protein
MTEPINRNHDDPHDVTREFMSPAAQRARAFLCYAPEDTNAASVLCKSLENRGFSCWFSARDVTPDLSSTQGIAEAIETCPYFVLVLTERVADSIEVRRELERAHEHNRVVLVLHAVESAGSPRTEYLLSTATWLKVADPLTVDDLEAAWTNLIELEATVLLRGPGEAVAEPSWTDAVNAGSLLVQLDGPEDIISGKTTCKLAEGEKLILGRWNNADVTVEDERASRRHAGLIVERDPKYGLELHLVDLMSTNGTWVRYLRDSDSELSKLLKHSQTRISSGAIIRIGSTDIRVTASPLPTSIVRI